MKNHASVLFTIFWNMGLGFFIGLTKMCKWCKKCRQTQTEAGRHRLPCTALGRGNCAIPAIVQFLRQFSNSLGNFAIFPNMFELFEKIAVFPMQFFSKYV
jgi:hypothetical protein